MVDTRRVAGFGVDVAVDPNDGGLRLYQLGLEVMSADDRAGGLRLYQLGLEVMSSKLTAEPDMVPGAPTIGTATLTDEDSASVTFAAPAFDGHDTITGYTVTSSPGALTASGAGSPLVVNGLTPDTSYTFTVHATNSIGNSAESAASNAVGTPSVPDPPTIGAATLAGSTSVSVAFTPPVDDGGDTIEEYTVTSSPGGLTTAGASSPLVVAGLTPGVTYTFTAIASNTVGDSASSAASNAVAVPAAASGGRASLSIRLGLPSI